MKKVKLFLVASGALLMASCGNNKNAEQKNFVSEPPREQYIEQIKKLENEMHQAHVINDVTAGLAIKAYSDYAMFFPKDTLSPAYLFKAGEVATAAKKYKTALSLYQTITSKYPDFKYIKESLYLQAFLLDNFLNDDAGAKIIYEDVIAKYPTTNYASDAKTAISNLGKTDEQLIEEFKKKNEKK
jgi:TolA-binding protein